MTTKAKALRALKALSLVHHSDLPEPPTQYTRRERQTERKDMFGIELPQNSQLMPNYRPDPVQDYDSIERGSDMIIQEQSRMPSYEQRMSRSRSRLEPAVNEVAQMMNNQLLNDPKMLIEQLQMLQSHNPDAIQ